MTTYEAQITMESNGNMIRITAGSTTVANWPENVIGELLEVLKGQLEGFVVTSKEVKP